MNENKRINLHTGAADVRRQNPKGHDNLIKRLRVGTPIVINIT